MRRSVTCYGLNVVFNFICNGNFFLIMVQLIDFIARRGGYVEGVGT